MASTGERILIVESDPDISDLVGRQALQPLGYQLTLAGEAGAAIKSAVQNPPDLILANLNLPGLSGKDLITALTSQGIRAPLVVIAEKGQEQSVIQSFRTRRRGCDSLAGARCRSRASGRTCASANA